MEDSNILFDRATTKLNIMTNGKNQLLQQKYDKTGKIFKMPTNTQEGTAVSSTSTKTFKINHKKNEGSWL